MAQDILILGLNPAWQRLFFLDKFELGEVHRISKVEEYASGKGINCGRVLQLLGGSPLLMHFLGSEHGSRIFDELSACGIQQAPVWIKEPTRICTTIVSAGESTELIEPSPVLTENENGDFLQTLNDYWSSTQYVALCGTFPKGFAVEQINSLDFTGKKVFVDAVENIDSWLEKGVELLKINMNEYSKILDRLGIPQVMSSPQFWKMSATAVLERLPIKNLVVTNEDSPVRAFRLQEGAFQGVQIQPPTIQVKNTVGAGDSFFAGWLMADSQGLSFEECLVKATAVAVARCETDRPWNLKLERVAELETELAEAVEKLE
ncbi:MULTISPECIES: 1-phosphofructokinase family hexose kinase [unclassified Fibrobacter]|uniref:1-phosphofructokinase family hexose kinase n=1 Tax=unclassified Fibrobacter TaxID=2634177 RepID=UPI000D6D46A5|nr:MULTISPECIES: PfkB family carbohydrate kinase [unclassified Fibrobacter]PWJ63702.1 1-phosphofructokinase [Fibrobacter sp. UWR4]PZW69090.1 1-phosphofructokinase [Fibrobacter sp. UWR1]